jgi:hypothetical protein
VFGKGAGGPPQTKGAVKRFKADTLTEKILDFLPGQDKMME